MKKFKIKTDSASDDLYFIPADPYLADEDFVGYTDEPHEYAGKLHELEWEVEVDEPRVTDHVSADMVNHPPHYTFGGIETIDYMQAKSTPEEFKGHLRLSTIKYLSRAGQKNTEQDDVLQDYEKALWYLLKLIDVMKMDKKG